MVVAEDLIFLARNHRENKKIDHYEGLNLSHFPNNKP